MRGMGVSQPPRKRRLYNGGRRGPLRSSVKIKLYHLPEAAKLPRLSLKRNGQLDIEVQRHMGMGYGYPATCFDTVFNKPKFASVSLLLSERQFTDYIHQTFPKLNGMPYHLYKVKKSYTKLSMFSGRTPEDFVGNVGVTVVYSPVNGPHPDMVQENPEDVVMSNVVADDVFADVVGDVVADDVVADDVVVDDVVVDDVVENDDEVPSYFPIVNLPRRQISSTLPMNASQRSTVVQPAVPVQSSTNLLIIPSPTADEVQLNVSTITHSLRARSRTIEETQQLLVDRSNILNDAIAAYSDCSLLNCKLYVRFTGEIADDFNGVTREFFSVFWEMFLRKYSFGFDSKNLRVTPETILSESTCKAVGRILLHGFLLNGYLPINLNPATLFNIMTQKQPSGKLVLDSFLKSLSTEDRHFLESRFLGYENFEVNEINTMVGIFQSYNVVGLPNNSERLLKLVENISQYVSMVLPYMMSSTMSIEHDITREIDEETFIAYLGTLQPTGAELQNIFTPVYSADPVLSMMEENVFEFLQRCVGFFSTEKCKKFFRFVSGHEVYTDKISVMFNGATNEEMMMPIGHTCGVQLELSRYFSNYVSFSTVLNNVLESSEASERFHFA